MDLIETYNKIKHIIQTVEFASLWPKFKKYNFALYNEDTVIINNKTIKKTDEFIGNTAIKYQGEYLAIWYLQNEMDENILASKLIHEMFHAFQNEQNEKRFPNEFEALLKYDNSLEILQLKYLESKYLLELDNKFSKNKFNAFLNLRYHRKKIYPFQYDYESKIEIVEGMAQFIELKALEQIDFTSYKKQLSKLKNRIDNLCNYFPIRVISYDIGTLLIKILIDNNLDFNQEISNNNDLLITRLLDKIDFKEISYNYDEEVIKNYKQDKNKLDKVIEEGLINYQEKITGDFNLKAFNVYNARYHKGFIYSKYFIIIDKKGILFGDFLIKIKAKKAVEIYKV
ncbi:MAG: hypothetical protein R6U15_03035 [Candidatus Izemoplasmatales bacterium]